MTTPSNQRLLHATGAECLATIAKDGLRARSYWSVDEGLAAYYAETVKDEDRVPVILVIDLAQLQAINAAALQPDLAGIEEPITTVICKKEREVHEAWKASDRDWQASLEIIESLRFDAVIPPSMIHVLEDGSLLPLVRADGSLCAGAGDIPAYMIEVSSNRSTLWVNSGKDGSAIGRFSKSFGIDVHTTGTEQIASGVECLLCTHEPAGAAEFERFRSAMREHHGVEVPASAMVFDNEDLASTTRPGQRVCRAPRA